MKMQTPDHIIKLENVERVYLLGIGGIGMSGLARYFNQRGVKVNGYDKTTTSLTDALVAEGVDIIFSDDVSLIPASLHHPAKGTLIIYTPAVPQTSAIFKHFKSGGFQIRKRSEVLGIISKGMFTIAVAGTHGKTTTSGIIAHLLKHSGYDCSAFLGGIATNYKTNILIGQSNTLVVEADEYDRSFLTLHPDIAIITSMDADHLDIYGDAAQLTETFKLFAGQVKKGGTLIYQAALPLSGGITYAAMDSADVKAEKVRVADGKFWFDFRDGMDNIQNLCFSLPGIHNIENALAAIKVALMLKISPEKIRAGLAAFEGIKRRFEYQVVTDDCIYIDDYAHHPAELSACIAAVKALYPHKRLTVIFQPHLFTRTRDFADGFAEALSVADKLFLLEIYPAREEPLEGITAGMLSDKISITDKSVCSKEEVLEMVKNSPPELLLTVGAGDIDTLVKPLKLILENA